MQMHARYLHEGVLQQPDHSSFHLGTTGCVVVEEDTIGEAELRLEFVFDQVYCEPVFSYGHDDVALWVLRRPMCSNTMLWPEPERTTLLKFAATLRLRLPKPFVELDDRCKVRCSFSRCLDAPMGNIRCSAVTRDRCKAMAVHDTKLDTSLYVQCQRQE